MEFRHVAITLSVIGYAVTAYGQASSSKGENSEKTQTFQQQRYDPDENVLKRAVQQASGFGELDTRYETALYELAAFYSADLKTRMWLRCLMSWPGSSGSKPNIPRRTSFCSAR